MYRKSIVLFTFVVLLMLGLIASAQDIDPLAGQAVSSFYDDYIANAGPGKSFVYAESEYLSADLIAAMDELYAEGLNYDPFLCVQDIPQQVSVQMLDADKALVREYFAGNPYSHNITVDLAQVDGEWKLDAIHCVDTVTPQGVTEAFYGWYLDYAGYDIEADTMRNPMVDRAYADSPYLSAGLIESMDSQLAEQPITHDPFVCAQDIPAAVDVASLGIWDDHATMMVREFFGDFAVPHRLIVDLVPVEDSWQIDAIRCEVAPADVASDFFNRYVEHARYDLEQGIDRTRLVDWGYNWSQFLSEDLYNSLAEAFSSDAPLVADPVLCAQDIPAFVQTENLETGDDRATVTFMGMYPSGPESATGYELGTATLQTDHGRWVLTAITCAAD